MKKLGIILLVLIFILGTLAFYLYQTIWTRNIDIDTDTYDLYIPNGTEYNELEKILESENVIVSVPSFGLTSRLMKYDQSNIKGGLFEIQNGWSNRKLIKHLRSGKQKPIKLTFNNARTIEDLVGKIATQIEIDSSSILKYLYDSSNLSNWGIDKEQLLCQLLPNTYEVYWNTSIENLMKKLIAERDKFWAQNERRVKAEKLGLSEVEVCILASIVEKETLVEDEKNTVAGVYTNRLEKGILLQADPTVVFANGDFSIRRVLNKHLEKDSPYNTYKYAGLPPGPIYMPNTSTLDAVLDKEDHSYLYFCAKPDNSGRHAFAKRLTDHNKNARIYQKWLNNRGIKK